MFHKSIHLDYERYFLTAVTKYPGSTGGILLYKRVEFIYTSKGIIYSFVSSKLNSHFLNASRTVTNIPHYQWSIIIATFIPIMLHQICRISFETVLPYHIGQLQTFKSDYRPKPLFFYLRKGVEHWWVTRNILSASRLCFLINILVSRWYPGTCK